MSNQKHYLQFEIMREIALGSVSGTQASAIADIALKRVAELVGLSASALILWDDKFEPILSITYAGTDENKGLLVELENELYAGLRRRKSLVSAYISLGGEKPLSSFTLPIRKGDQILGAVIGVQSGKGTLIKEDEFLEGLAAALSMAVMIWQLEAIIEKEKFNVSMATAATVNHEINNPLQAILGIVQLLPKERKDLDESLLRKLKLIEESALAIMRVTHKLMNITEIKLTDYVNGTKMLKLPEDENSS